MKVLEYNELDLTGVGAQYRKLRRLLEADDLRSAEVSKLAHPEGLYRARLDHTNRLLLRFGHHRGERYALVLEVVRNHAYDKARFLNGASVDEDRLEAVLDALPEAAALPELPYVNPRLGQFHLLDKVISFDDAQEEIRTLALPALVIGSAGSGKTALTLEKLKALDGEGLYVTLSAWLAGSARDLYYAHGYGNPRQQVDFLSLREFLETIRVPRGRELDFAAFRGWFERHRAQAKGIDAHALHEEFRGVLTGLDASSAQLTREQYLALGVRQSIFLGDEREIVYALFEKYRAWLPGSGRYDGNLLAHEYLGLIAPRYDWLVVDEVQDLTNVQLALLLKTLRTPGRFLLCGDANQVVHPNFFSWARLRSLFWQDAALEGEQLVRVLAANYRNTPEVTALANRLLKLRQRRFGAIDRESSVLIEARSTGHGEARLLADTPAARRELDRHTQQSARTAVLVLRDEDKPAARAALSTPLLFSIQEAKGLEYENVVLFGFVAAERQRYAALCEDIEPADLDGDELRYARGRDKTDKSVEGYKFFVNALYVAITRATKNVYLLEADPRHPLLVLLGLLPGETAAGLAGAASSHEDWSREARRLELQGKHEQAEAIRTQILRPKTVPWEVMTAERWTTLFDAALDPKQVSKKPRTALEEYAAACGDRRLMRVLNGLENWQHRLALDDLYEQMKRLGRQEAEQQRLWKRHQTLQGEYRQQLEQLDRRMAGLAHKAQAPYAGRHFKDVLRQCEQYGVDYRSAAGQTPLMVAAQLGNLPLVEALLERGADPEQTDLHGCTAWHLALARAFAEPDYARGAFVTIHERLVPASTVVESCERLWKLDAQSMEHFVLNAMIALLRRKLAFEPGAMQYSSQAAGYTAADLCDAAQHLPEPVLRATRKKRTAWNAVLARNEADSDSYAYNRRLFWRTTTGAYLPDPRLALRIGSGEAQTWVPVWTHLNLDLLRRYPNSPGNLYVDHAGTLIGHVAARCASLEQAGAG